MGCGGNLMGGKMGQREKLSLVYDADGSIGVVMEFSESDFEAYSMPHLALVGAFQTKAQAAQALGDLLFNSSERRRWCCPAIASEFTMRRLPSAD
jgi:hypothetical protein